MRINSSIWGIDTRRELCHFPGCKCKWLSDGSDGAHTVPWLTAVLRRGAWTIHRFTKASYAMPAPMLSSCCAVAVLCLQAGIRVVVVTGDNQATAEAVCRSIGALGEDAGLDSQQLSSLSGAATAMVVLDHPAGGGGNLQLYVLMFYCAESSLLLKVSCRPEGCWKFLLPSSSPHMVALLLPSNLCLAQPQRMIYMSFP